MKAIQINSENKTVSQVNITTDFNSIYPAIGNECTSFECVTNYKNGDGLYVDEEALLKLNDAKGAFTIEGFQGILIGNGVVIGHNKDGNTVDCKTTVEEIQKKVKFVDIDEVRKKS